MRLYERTTEQVRAELCAFCGEAHWPATCAPARKYGRTMRRLARKLKVAGKMESRGPVPALGQADDDGPDCRDCGRPCSFPKDGEGFHRDQ